MPSPTAKGQLEKRVAVGNRLERRYEKETLIVSNTWNFLGSKSERQFVMIVQLCQEKTRGQAPQILSLRSGELS
uniref:Uncharacterized protein n=1 Tax=Tetraselmis sp. GSL018 TaxID=582737 RepID=A0A061SBF7_9CHLO